MATTAEAKIKTNKVSKEKTMTEANIAVLETGHEVNLDVQRPVQVITDPVTVVTAETAQVKEYFNGLLLQTKDELQEGAKQDALRGREYTYRTDLQVIALASKFRDEAAGDAKALQAAAKNFKKTLESLGITSYKKIAQLIFPTKSVYSQLRVREFVDYMLENKASISTAHKNLYETKPEKQIAEPKETSSSTNSTESSGGSEATEEFADSTEVLALPLDDATIEWTLDTFNSKGQVTQTQATLNALATLKALLDGHVTVDKVKAKYGGK